MFVNNATGQRGRVCQYDLVCFDEVAGIKCETKEGVNIMKGYMVSGQFSRGRENIRAEGSLVMVGNFDVDVEHQQRIGHLFGPLPPEMRDDTAFMDRIHRYIPGWDFPKYSHPSFDFSLFSFERVPYYSFRAGISTPGTQNTVMVFHLIIPDHLRDCKTHRAFLLAGSAASTCIILHR